MKEKMLKNLALSMGIDKIEFENNTVTLSFSYDITKRIDGIYLFDLKQKYNNINLTYQNQVVKIIFKIGKNPSKDFDLVMDYLNKVKSHHIHLFTND